MGTCEGLLEALSLVMLLTTSPGRQPAFRNCKFNARSFFLRTVILYFCFILFTRAYGLK